MEKLTENFLSFELNENYFNLAKERLEKHTIKNMEDIIVE